MTVELVHGDCLAAMREMPENSVDSVVCDPPYLLGFMGQNFDKQNGAHTEPQKAQAWHEAWAREAFRVLKPGGFALVAGGTRTFHRLVCGLEDAGFEIRDTIMHCYGSGFPKSLDVSKAIDKLNGKHLEDLSLFGDYVKERRVAKGMSLRELDEHMGTNTAASWWEGRKSGVQLPSLETYKRLKMVLELDNRFDALIEWAEAEREVVGKSSRHGGGIVGNGSSYELPPEVPDLTAPGTDAAKQWTGWGTSLKPSFEPWTLCRKPLSEKSVAAQVLATGTGAINVDASRILGTVQKGAGSTGFGEQRDDGYEAGTGREYQTSGRWPSNLVLSHSPDCQRVGTKRVKGTPKSYVRGADSGNKNAYGATIGEPAGTFSKNYADPDGQEEVADFRCVEGCPVLEMDRQSGTLRARGNVSPTKQEGGSWFGAEGKPGVADAGTAGGASRFFQTFELDTGAGFRYQAKASRAERTANGAVENGHPTVKPLALMRYLVRMVTPPGGTCLDCFLGSGTTGVAAVLEGFDFIGIEADETYIAIARKRIANALEPVEPKKNGKPPKARNTYGFKSTDVLRRCPEHGESIPSGATTYKCGCEKVWVKATDERLSAQRLF